MSANIAKIAKVTRCMPVDLTKKKLIQLVTGVCLVLKTPFTNIAKIARITNLTRFTTLEKTKPRDASRCPQISLKSQK